MHATELAASLVATIGRPRQERVWMSASFTIP
jgi:hypothetical protein